MLSEGGTVAHYTVRERLGAGSMGEVWRAHDTRLDREVALKVLPAELVGDPARVARLEREARSIAALSHPHVAAVHGLERVDGASVLAMELVEGEDLAERLARGPLDLDEALDVARQIADGLEAAHEAGVVHRDLKPANVRRTPDGTVKLIDFGLAKPSPGRPGSSAAGITLEGVAVGTPAYMAPEQARGRAVDRRADVWALGCVLYECLAGRRAFGGEDVAEVLAAVLDGRPDWSALPARTPARVRALLERCLVVDPRRRLRDAGDARVELELAREGAPEPAAGAPARRGGFGLALGGAAVGLLGAFGLARLGLLGVADDAEPEPPRRLRVSIESPDTSRTVWPRIAPDGSAIVYAALTPTVVGEPVPQLYLRPLDRDETVPLPGTERPETCAFAPDGSALAVCVADASVPSGFALLRVDLPGDEPTTRIGVWPNRFDGSSGIAWLGNGEIVASGEDDSLIVWDSAGVQPRRRLPIRRTLEDAVYQVEVLRALGDAHHVLASAYTIDESGFRSVLVAVDVRDGVERVIEPRGQHGAVHGDTLLFTRGDTLFRRPFDPGTLTASGAPRSVATGLYVQQVWEDAWFDVARDGTLVWKGGGVQGDARRLDVMERDGTVAPFATDRAAFDGSLATSPDGSFVAATLAGTNGLLEVWGTETDRPLLRRLLALPGADVGECLPLPGGDELLFGVGYPDREQLLRAPVAAPTRGLVLLERARGEPPLRLGALSPDGNTLLLVESREEEVAVRAYDLRSDRLAEEPLFTLPMQPSQPHWSPDGRWIAYFERVMGGHPVVREVREEGGVGPAIPLPLGPVGGYRELTWRKTDLAEGLELLLLTDDRRTVYALPFDGGARPTFGEAVRIGRAEGAPVMELEALPDGRALLGRTGEDEESPDQIELAIGFLETR